MDYLIGVDLGTSGTKTVLFDSLGNYAYRKSDEDTRVAEFQNLVGQLTKTGVELGCCHHPRGH